MSVRVAPAALLQSRICRINYYSSFGMYSVYLLQSEKFPGKTYVGLTIKTPKERLKEHNIGLSQYTKAYLPWKLIYFENFYCKLCADKREQFLKSGIGFRFRKIMLDNYRLLE